MAIQISRGANPIPRGGGGQPHIKLGKTNCQGGERIKAPPEVNPVLTRDIEFTSGDIPKVYHYVPTSKKTTLRQTYGC